jgi:hypothetical protein
VSAAHRRGASLERRTARALGSRRVIRARGQRAPDVECVRLPCGVEVVIECKHRKSLPALIRNALKQAAGYSPGSVPVAILQAFGQEAVAVVPLDLFRQLTGLKAPMVPVQPSLLATRVL